MQGALQGSARTWANGDGVGGPYLFQGFIAGSIVRFQMIRAWAVQEFPVTRVLGNVLHRGEDRREGIVWTCKVLFVMRAFHEQMQEHVVPPKSNLGVPCEEREREKKGGLESKQSGGRRTGQAE